jgi:multidrug efflux pump subunit AcrA (membrane-fusion protein)
VEQRANLVREMTRLSKAVVQSGEDLVYTGSTDGLPPEIRDHLEVFIDESGSKALVATLLYKPEWAVDGDPSKPKDKVPYGVLIAEQIGDEIAPTDMHARTEVVSRHASNALYNASEHSKIFGRPVLQALGTPARTFRGRTLAKIGAVLALLLVAIAVMAFVPWELTIDGRGSLLPEHRRALFSPYQAVVKEVLVDHWDKVAKGQVLVRLESKELDKELEKLRAERADAASREANLETQQANSGKPDEATQLRGELDQARIKKESATEQIAILEEQKKMLDITAPFDGIVTTWEVKKNLMNRPVDIGQELIQIADMSQEFALEVEVADNDMAPILKAKDRLEKDITSGAKPADTSLGAWFVTATDPEHRYNGYVRRIAGKADTVEQKHVVKVTVGFDDSVRQDFLKRNQDFRPGAEVRARIKCGEAKLAYVLLRDIVHVWHETVMFRWPFLN